MSQRIESLESQAFSWNGVLDPSLVNSEHVAASHSLADAAKIGDWSTVFDLLDDETQTVDINWWRPGGTAWFTVLHQAAWHAAPPAVVAGLIARGALTSLTDSRGRTALDIRMERDAAAGTRTRVIGGASEATRTLDLAAGRHAHPGARSPARRGHRQPHRRQALRRPQPTAGIALPARCDPAGSPRPPPVVPSAWDVRRIRHRFAPRLSRDEQLEPRRRRVRSGTRDHPRRGGPRRRGVRLTPLVRHGVRRTSAEKGKATWVALTPDGGGPRSPTMAKSANT